MESLDELVARLFEFASLHVLLGEEESGVGVVRGKGKDVECQAAGLSLIAEVGQKPRLGHNGLDVVRELVGDGCGDLIQVTSCLGGRELGELLALGCEDSR